MLKLDKKLVPYADNTQFRCYEDEAQETIKPKPIPEYLLIETGSISRNTTKSIPLTRYENPLKPESIFVSVEEESDEKLQIEIYNNLANPQEKVFVDNYDRNDLPLTFPPIVLFPFNEIRIKPRYNLFNCLILLRPCILIDHWNLDETS